MADHMTIEHLVAECIDYWRVAGIPVGTASEMGAELASHLREADGAGKNPADVVGLDLTAFAEAWAAEHRQRPADWPAVGPLRTRHWAIGSTRRWLLPVIVAVGALTIFGPKEAQVDDLTFWRWLWIGIALFLGVGEMVTAGFFLLPFAIGAAVAALLAWIGVAIPIQLLVFLATSIAALVAMRRFAWSDREPSHSVGALRFVNASATVIETIDAAAGTGRVRMDTEHWRAVSTAGVIEAGTEVKVVDVRGARLVVEPHGDQG